MERAKPFLRMLPNDVVVLVIGLSLLVAPVFAGAVGPLPPGLDPFEDRANDCGSGQDAPDEPDDAIRVEPGESCRGHLTPSEDDRLDWFVFPADEGRVVVVHVAADEGSGAFRFCVHRGNGKSTGCSTHATSVPFTFTRPSAMSRAHPVAAGEGGMWSVELHAFDDHAGRYTLTVHVHDPLPHDDCGTGADAPGSHAAAARLDLPVESCTGHLVPDDHDHADSYRFHAPAGHVIRVTYAATGEFSQACLSIPAGEHPRVCTRYIREGVERIEAYVAPGDEGDSRLNVRNTFGSATYTLAITTEPADAPAPTDDCGTGGDASDSVEAPTLLVLPVVECEATIARLEGDTIDWYAVHVEEGQRLRIEERASRSLALSVHVRSPSGTLYGLTSNGSPILVRADETGSWRVGFDGAYDTGGAYAFSLGVHDPLLPLPPEADRDGFLVKQIAAHYACYAERAVWHVIAPGAEHVCPDVVRADDSTFLRDLARHS